MENEEVKIFGKREWSIPILASKHLEIEQYVTYREWGIGVAFLFGGPYGGAIFGIKLHFLMLYYEFILYEGN